MSHLTDGQINIYRIARVLGHCSVDDGQLCDSIKVNPWSKWKPFRHTSPNFVSDQAQMNAASGVQYGFTGPVFTSKAALFSGTPANGAMNYNYERPNVYFRERDFLGYFHRAKPAFMQAVGPIFTLDLMPINPDPVLFYLLLKTGLLANKPFSTTMGIEAPSQKTAVDAGDLDYNICVEDLTFDDGMAGTPLQLIDPSGNYEAYLGVVVDKGSGQEDVRYVEFFEDTYPVEAQTVIHTEMYRVGTQAIATSLQLGDYPAVACARIVYGGFKYFLPVYSRRSFPAKFALKCGGLDNYRAAYRGLCETKDGDFTAELTGADRNKVYLKIRFYNQRGRSLDVLFSNNIKLCLEYTVQSVDLSGGVTSVEDDRGNYITVNRTEETITFQTDVSPVPASVSIPDKDYYEFVFRIDKPFQQDATVETSARLGGSYVNITPKLKFKNGSSDYFKTYGGSTYTFPTFKYTLS